MRIQGAVSHVSFLYSGVTPKRIFLGKRCLPAAAISPHIPVLDRERISLCGYPAAPGNEWEIPNLWPWILFVQEGIVDVEVGDARFQAIAQVFVKMRDIGADKVRAPGLRFV